MRIKPRVCDLLRISHVVDCIRIFTTYQTYIKDRLLWFWAILRYWH